jgi:hypothetical protein
MALMYKRYGNVLVVAAYVTHFAWPAPLSMEIHDHSATLSFGTPERSIPGSDVSDLHVQFSNKTASQRNNITSSGLDIAVDNQVTMMMDELVTASAIVSNEAPEDNVT